MPAALKPYRDDELRNLRGDDQQGPYEAHDRVYRYDVYNDLGDSRQILGGSKEFPYPRRCRTGRKPREPASAAGAEHLRAAGRAVRASQEVGLPGLLAQGAGRWHRAGHPHLRRPLPRRVRLLRRHPQALRGWHQAAQHPGPRGGAQALPAPARQGPHPHGRRTPAPSLRRISGIASRASPRSRQWPATGSTSLTTTMPFLVDINNLDGSFVYATRTLLFRRGDGTLAPVAIELSSPLIQGDLTTAKSTVYTPHHAGVEGWIWQLAKAYASVNDYGWHQLISHWLNTHAVMEPFVIATNRQLSVTHPVYKLLHPHYRDTMNINARARGLLINAGGVIEMTVFPRKHAMPMSSMVYKNWNFTEQALPDDLIKRGMAVEDPSSPHKVRLLIEDYPYAADGLEVWHAIEQWVTEYLTIYYPDDGVLQGDVELQAWWKEVREVGHGDLKDAAWWPKMHTVAELIKACATIIWTGSALHAAVNFGQYPYSGYHPNKPSASRRPMPVPGSEEYALLERDPEKAFILTITNQFQALVGISLMEILSKHSSDEVYLGQHETPAWTSDAKAQEAFRRFGARLEGIEKQVVAMNGDPRLKNRTGPAKFPYMLLYPNTSDHTGQAEGLTARGIPNSISI
ncbi:unnamed protein product [Triticum turgidum subsp. durum]|uniref:Lipoxygenase n=1 Tax=Triticum turgidum subsp. durum TaxID=4567 RepID=A0A9R0TX16_TRITD|nr:unnamed protein product [Triticum turgidum subsp. durum]